MAICNRCGESVNRTYGGRCTSCMFTEAATEEKAKVDEEHSLAGLKINNPIESNFLDLYKSNKQYNKNMVDTVKEAKVENEQTKEKIYVSISDELIIITHKSDPEQRFGGTAEISKMDGTYYGVEGDDVWYFNRLFVPIQLRNKGVANKLLGRLVKVLKDEKLALICEINSYGDLTKDQLKKLYAEYGFKDTGKGYMLIDERRGKRG